MLTGLLIGLFVFIALLAIPVTLKFRVGSQGLTENEFEVGWAFGLVRVQIPAEGGEPETRDETKKRKRSGGASKVSVKLVSNRAARRRMSRYVGDLWRSIGKKDVMIRIRAGLDDPADTGQLWALLGPVSAVFVNIRQLTINLEPSFLGECFEFYGSGFIKFNPLRILSLSLGLLLSPVIWRAVRESR